MGYPVFAFLSSLHLVAAFQAILQEDPLPQARQQQDVGASELRPRFEGRRRRGFVDVPPKKHSTIDRSMRRRRATQHNIPLQLVMTAKEGSVDELPPQVRDNVRKTLKLNPDLQVRFLDDKACQKFIAANFADLEASFASEKYGPFRGDICRAAVLALEGGFYADLDLEFRLSFSDLVENTTTFMSVWSGLDCDIMNALVAVERGSEVMQSVLEAIKAWYTAESSNGKLMGTQTMMRGLDNIVARDCPGVDIRRRDQFDFDCGPHHQFRLFREDELRCPWTDGSPECPAGRAQGPSFLKWGIFEPPLYNRNLVAYSRYENCTVLGCGEKQEMPNQRRARQSWCRGENDGYGPTRDSETRRPRVSLMAG